MLKVIFRPGEIYHMSPMQKKKLISMCGILPQVDLPPLSPLPESFQEQELPGFPSQPIPWTESCSGRLEVILELFKESVKFVKIVIISKNKNLYKVKGL